MPFVNGPRSVAISCAHPARGGDQRNRLVNLSRSRWISAFLAVAAMLALSALSANAQSGFEGSLSFTFEAERKSCRNCLDEPQENEIDTTPIELVLRPINRPDLSFGLEFDHDVDSEGGFFGSGRTNVEKKNAIKVWARKEFSEFYWGRLQSEIHTTDNLLDVGARFGFRTDLGQIAELSGYFNVDRRFATGGGDQSEEGTLVEIRLQPEWDFEDYGAWVEFRADRFFFNSASGDRARFSVEPGLWFDLGDTPHKGVIWLELERRTRADASDFQRDTHLIGLGIEFDIGKRRELFVGVRGGKERETERGGPTRKSSVGGIILEFSKRF